MVEPVRVLDAREEPMRARLGTPWHMSLLDWFKQEGINPRNVYRLEVYLVDCPSGRIFEYDVDQEGNRYVKAGQDEAARRRPYDVILSSLPPM